MCSIAIIAINRDGKALAGRLKADFKNAKVFSVRMDRSGALKNLVREIFDKYDGLIFIAALGIVVRLIGPLARTKLSDPAVVAVDTAGRFAVSVLSGHEGGANRLAYLAAASLGASPVVTTGKEVHKKFILGIGTRRGAAADDIGRAIAKALKKKDIKPDEVRVVATVDLKKTERGLIEACSSLGLPLVFIPKEEIKNFRGAISKSDVVRRHIGLDGVCEPCALLAGRAARLILKKEILCGIAVAIAEEGLV